MTRLAAALRDQAQSCATLGSPFMSRLCNLLADRLSPGSPLTDRLFNWPGELGSSGASVPLRLCSALHALRLLGRADLAPLYPPHNADDAALWTGVSTALSQEYTFISNWIDSPPQTNEVRRSAVLIAAAQWIGARIDLPLRLSELGASGGLNLMWDRYALRLREQTYGPADAALTLTPDWSGPLPPIRPAPKVVERRGVDLAPPDIHTPAGQLRLRACLWPDQPHRLALTDAALGIASAPVDKGDAADWLAARLTPQSGTLHLVYHTVAWQYFDQATSTRASDLIAAAGAVATADTPLALLGMEADGQGRGAALTLRLWPDDLQISLGRADFHGRWIDWTAPDI